MAKKRKGNESDNLKASADKAAGQFARAAAYSLTRDTSAEMRRNVNTAGNILDKKWSKYQESLVADAKKNRRKP